MLAALAIAVVVVVIAATQLILPRFAASDLRARLEREGEVLSVKVSAFPAIQLLWHHADSVSVKLADYQSAPGDVPGLLEEATNVGRLNVSIGTLRSGLLTLHDVTLTKRGSELIGSARVDEADLRAALPVIDSVTPVSSSDGQLRLRGTAGAFGISATVTAVVTARDGKLVVVPSGLLGGFVNVTVFSDPDIYVQAVSGTAISGGLTVSVRAELR
jgi:hypothetical protein